MSGDGPGPSPETITKSVPFPDTMLTYKPLDADSMTVVRNQWNLFQTLKDHPGPVANPIRERLARGEPALVKGTLVHGAIYTPELVEGIKRLGIVSGEFIGIPEDGETSYSGDFFKVPEDMSVQEYMAFISKGRQISEKLFVPQPEYNYLPSYKKRTSHIAYLIDPDPRLDELLSQDAYDPKNEAMKKIIHRLPVKDVDSEVGKRLSAILVGVPSNFISGMVLGSGVTPDQTAHIRQVMGESVVLFDSMGAVINSQAV